MRENREVGTERERDNWAKHGESWRKKQSWQRKRDGQTVGVEQSSITHSLNMAV